MIFWVDDCIFYPKNYSSINELIDNLKEDFLLVKEENMAWFWDYQLIDRKLVH